MASATGNKDIVELLLSKGADVNVKDADRKTPLYYAIAKGYNNVARILRNHGGIQ